MKERNNKKVLVNLSYEKLCREMRVELQMFLCMNLEFAKTGKAHEVFLFAEKRLGESVEKTMHFCF